MRTISVNRIFRAKKLRNFRRNFLNLEAKSQSELSYKNFLYGGEGVSSYTAKLLCNSEPYFFLTNTNSTLCFISLCHFCKMASRSAVYPSPTQSPGGNKLYTAKLLDHIFFCTKTNSTHFVSSMTNWGIL